MASRSNEEKLALAREKLKKYQRKQESNSPALRQLQDPSTDPILENNLEGDGIRAENEPRNLSAEVGVSPAAEGAAYENDHQQQSFSRHNNYLNYQNSLNQEDGGVESTLDASNGYPSGQEYSQVGLSQDIYRQEQDGNIQEEEKYEYSAWEYQQYINSILQELESVKFQLAEYQEASSLAATDPRQILAAPSNQNDQNSQLNLYITKADEMAALLETANSEISQLQRQIDDSSDLLNKTQQKCRGLQQENHNLQQRMSYLEEEDQRHVQDKSRMAKQIEELEKQLAHQHELVNTLKAQISKLTSTEKDQFELRVELEGSRDAIKGLEVQVETMSSSLQHEKKQNAELTKMISTLEQELQVKSNENDLIKQELSDSKNELQEKVAHISALQENDGILRNKMNDMEALLKIESQKATEYSVKALENQSKSSVAAVSSQIIHVTERCQALQDENTTLVTRLEEIRQRNIILTNEKLTHSEKIVELESKLMKLTSQSLIGETEPEQMSPGFPPIPYPNNVSATGKHRRSSADARPAAPVKESDLLNQVSTLTAKLLDLELENKRLVETIAGQESLQLPNVIATLEKQNGQLKNELEKERKVTILLQAEVDALPDMIEKYHQERRALIQRINQAALHHSLKEKEETEKIKQVSTNRFGAMNHPIISCPQCLSNPLILI